MKIIGKYYSWSTFKWVEYRISVDSLLYRIKRRPRIISENCKNYRNSNLLIL